MGADPGGVDAQGPWSIGSPEVTERLTTLGLGRHRLVSLEPLHVGRPNIGDRDALVRRLDDILERRWLTNDGPYVRELERVVAAEHDVAHCVATSSGTTALQLAARALDFRGEVIAPSFTFVGTAHVLHWDGVRPVFCDIDPATHNIDPSEIEALIGEETSGIIGVHLWGRPCAIDALEEIAASRGLPLLFDGAHAFGSTYRARSIARFGAATAVSFHATKFVNSFEGGAVLTNSDRIAKRVRLLRNFGFSGEDRTATAGINAKLSEPAAAMGLTSIESAPRFRAVNAEHHAAYRSGLADVAGISLATYDAGESNHHHYVIVEVDAERVGLTRDALQQVLIAGNVFARRYFHPGCHRLEPYVTLDLAARHRLPHTDRLSARVLALPTGTAVTPDDIGTITSLIRDAVAIAPEVMAATSTPGP
jgi:dTDP-4-amino-4,6-dideoxygalactose transaminase